MKKFSFISVALLICAAALVHADNIVDEIIARVNDQIITSSQFQRAKDSRVQELKQQFPNDWQTRWTAAQKDVLREMIDEQLLLEKGKSWGSPARPKLSSNWTRCGRRWDCPPCKPWRMKPRNRASLLKIIKRASAPEW